jgi:hypothetical protein
VGFVGFKRFNVGFRRFRGFKRFRRFVGVNLEV